MMERRNPLSLPRTRVAALPAMPPRECSFEAPRLGRFISVLARAGAAFLDRLNRLGARPLDAEALDRARARQAAVLRIRSIGH